jgi:hypothetical protein
MRLINIKSKAAFGVRVHGKMPSYFLTSERRRDGVIDGRVVEFVLHPKKTGDRVNFISAKEGEWLFVDDQALWDAVAGKAKLEFETAEGRAKKAPEAAETTTEEAVVVAA